MVQAKKANPGDGAKTQQGKIKRRRCDPLMMNNAARPLSYAAKGETDSKRIEFG